MPENLTWEYPILLISSILLGLGSVGVLFMAMSLKDGVRRRWMLMATGLLPFVFSYLWNPLSKTMVSHGFLQISIVNQLIIGNIPPNDPLIAGQRLSYPWGHHALIALTSKIFRLSPDIVFPIFSLVALAATMYLVYKISVFITDNWISGVFSVVLSTFGVSILNRGPFASKLYGRPFLERLPEKKIGFFSKFLQIESSSFGIPFVAAYLYFLIQIFTPVSQSKRRRNLLGFFISIIGTGFFYPLFWPGILASGLAVCGVFYLKEKRKRFPELLSVTFCLFITGLILYPFFHLLSSTKVDSTLTLNTDLYSIFIKTASYLWGTLPLSILILLKRKVFFQLIPKNHKGLYILFTTVIVNAALYVFISGTEGTEYKFYMISWFTLGILSGVSLADFFSTKKWLCFLITTSFLISSTPNFLYFSFGDWQPTDFYTSQGIYLTHKNQDENALYRWIIENTTKSAAFIDNRLTIPVFSNRELYVALDSVKKESDSDTAFYDGWRFKASRFLMQQGYQPDIIQERTLLATEIYSDTSSSIDKDFPKKLNKTFNRGDLFVVSRDSNTQQKLKNHSAFKQAFTSGDISLYQLSG